MKLITKLITYSCLSVAYQQLLHLGIHESACLMIIHTVCLLPAVFRKDLTPVDITLSVALLLFTLPPRDVYCM